MYKVYLIFYHFAELNLWLMRSNIILIIVKLNLKNFAI